MTEISLVLCVCRNTSTLQFSDITFNNVFGLTTGTKSISVACSPAAPCNDVSRWTPLMSPPSLNADPNVLFRSPSIMLVFLRTLELSQVTPAAVMRTVSCLDWVPSVLLNVEARNGRKMIHFSQCGCLYPFSLLYLIDLYHSRYLKLPRPPCWA